MDNANQIPWACGGYGYGFGYGFGSGSVAGGYYYGYGPGYYYCGYGYSNGYVYGYGTVVSDALDLKSSRSSCHAS